MNEFYKIPFDFEALLQQKQGKFTCSVAESIRQHITMIIMTRLESFRFDPMYGCRIWGKDFIVPSNLNTWKDEIKEALFDSIQRYELRIEEITAFTVEVKYVSPSGIKRINQRLDIQLAGSIRGLNDSFRYEETLFFSPVSLV